MSAYPPNNLTPRRRSAACLMLLGTLLSGNTHSESLFVGDFSQYTALPAPPWQIVRFDEEIPPTEYTLTEQQGIKAVQAQADASMALLARPLDADLTQTPVLCWRWWVDQPLAQADMTQKSGDDYAARVYVTFDLPDNALSFGTRFKLDLARAIHGDDLPDAALNYVWDNKHPIGTQAPNAFTDRAQMWVLRTGDTDTGRWIEERRHLPNDLGAVFETSEARPLQLAIASDSDNTGTQTGALFADLHLVSEDEACQFTSD